MPPAEQSVKCIDNSPLLPISTVYCIMHVHYPVVIRHTSWCVTMLTPRAASCGATMDLKISVTPH